MLQHGSIVVGRRFDQQPSGAVSTELPPGLDPLRSTFAQEFTKATGEPCEGGRWLEAETEAAEELVPKYAGCGWTRRV